MTNKENSSKVKVEEGNRESALNGGDIFSSNLEVEFGENNKKAVVSVPLITAGENDKHIVWSRNVLNKITNEFRGVVFKYDVNGTQGSSHVPEHLYSPFYDVGWTYEDVRGCWFDGNRLWVKGEITKPEVVEKLSRVGANGRRELNAASSGVLLNYDHVVCTICGKLVGECEHQRGHEYNGEVAGIRPVSEKAVKRALHVALTNDPADGEAIIKEVILQELRDNKKLYEEKNNNEELEKGDKEMSEEDKENLESPKDEEQEEVSEEKENVETASKKEDGDDEPQPETAAKGMITCPKCGYKFKAENAEMERKDNMSQPKEVNSVPERDIAPNASSDESTNYNRGKTNTQGKVESADLLESKYKKRVVDSIKEESDRLGREMVETADMNINQLETIEQTLRTTPSPKKGSNNSQKENVKFNGQDRINGYGAPSQQRKSGRKEFADMTPEERVKKYGEDGAFAMCFADNNALAKDYMEKRKKMNKLGDMR